MKTTKKHPHRKQYRTIIGVDLGDRKSHVCVTDKDGNILSETTVGTNKKALAQLADSHKGSLFAIEVGTHSPWISRLFEERGCPCLVANARKLRAIYTNDRKCDMLDARMLAKLARVDPDLLSPIEHGCEQDQIHRMSLTLRDSLVRQRVAIVGCIRFTLKSLGLRLPACSTITFAKRCREELEDSPLFHAVETSLNALEAMNESIKQYERHISRTAAEHHPETKLLEQVSGVGPITSLSFALAVGDPQRFEDPRDVGAYFGLVPKRDQSGGSDKQLSISKAGNRDVRRLLVQAAQYILGAFGPDCDLREYGLRMTVNGGKAAKKKAVIAVARKLAVLMLVLWKTGQPYEPLRKCNSDASASNQAA